jgi:hypothetical protein
MLNFNFANANFNHSDDPKTSPSGHTGTNGTAALERIGCDDDDD